MAEKTTLARPYAKAAFDFAKQENQIQAWANFLSACKTIVLHPDFALMYHPKFKKTEFLKLVQAIIKNQMQMSSSQENFLKTLLHYRRIDLLPEISSLFEMQIKEEQKQISVTVTTATNISPTIKEKLIKALQIRLQKEVVLNVEVKPELIGGAIVKAGDFVLDGSVRSSLQRMQKELEA